MVHPLTLRIKSSMNIKMSTIQASLRECISSSDDKLVIFGADNFLKFPGRDATIRSRCDRALPGASLADLVVLRGDQNREYYDWLRCHSAQRR